MSVMKSRLLGKPCVRCGKPIGCGGARGCCNYCYAKAQHAVSRDKSNWDELERMGLVRRAVTK